MVLVTERDWQVLRALFRVGPLLVGGVLAAGWYLACLIGHRYDFLHLQLGSENFGRFFGSLGAMPPWYYARPLLFNSLPLSLFVPIAVVAALIFHRVQKSNRVGQPQSEAGDPLGPVEIPQETDGAGLAARFLAILLDRHSGLFRLAAFKRRADPLPRWPAAAFLLAWWVVDRLAPRLGPARGTIVYWIATGLCLIFSPAVEFPLRPSL